MAVSEDIQYIEHITSEGERWDQLSWKYYGTPFEYERIIAANPTVPITPILPGGITLLIPVIENDASMTGEELPPWKL